MAKYRLRTPKRTKQFYKPPSEQLKKLKRGDIVKLVFAVGKGQCGANVVSERMWVILEGCKGGVCRGKLDNKPACIKGLKAGDKIRFNRSQIINIYGKG